MKKILFIIDNNKHHFALAGTNNTIIFNPCDIDGTVFNIQEIYAFAQ